MNMKNVALVTGASSGIGLELATYHASLGGDLVLVARRGDVLEDVKTKLEAEYQVNVVIFAEDLADEGAAQRIYEFTQHANIHVAKLINNAGFGGHGLFYERSLVADTAMVQVNIVALIQLTHLYLADMVKTNHGRILNVSSTASFLPGPLQATYYATKAFVTSFSQALTEELRDTKITVTALCPGAVNTGFVSAGNLEGVEVFKNARDPGSVARCGYTAMEKGQLLAFNETGLKFLLNWVIPFLPRKLVLKMSRQSMEKQT